MSKYEKLILRILSGFSDKNIQFQDLCWLLKNLGFDERIKGSHYIFTKVDINEIINLYGFASNDRNITNLHRQYHITTLFLTR